MTDNEKRAHDLALSLSRDELTKAWNKNGKLLDPYITYKMIYDETLIKLNIDYPNQENL